jgi:hypothetical protein
MARYFFDSSALVKRYHQESGSSEVDQLFDSTGNHFIVSRLALVEIQSSFARLVRESVIAISDFESLIARLNADVVSGLLTVTAVRPSAGRCGSANRHAWAGNHYHDAGCDSLGNGQGIARTYWAPRSSRPKSGCSQPRKPAVSRYATWASEH